MKRRTTRRERVKIFRVAREKNVNAFGSYAITKITNSVTDDA